MLTQRIIPCLDIRDGRVVKGVRFQGLRDAGDPAELAQSYEQQGADELVVLDVSATREGRAAALHTIEDIRRVLGIPLTVGGGVRTLDDALALLAAGADKVGVNTAAVERPLILTELADRVGRQCVVLSVDAASNGEGQPGWSVVTHAGTRRLNLDAVQWAEQGQSLGAGEVLLTSWDRDGTLSGYDTALLREVCRSVRIPVVASGGADSAAHMHEAFEAGASAVLAASIFHDGRHTVASIKQELAGQGVEVRR
ncbi:MAG: imidazole glycerol phosphate synthase subunit HisF [Planctomycetota bacterium]